MLDVLFSSIQLVLVVFILVFAIFSVVQWFRAIPVKRAIVRMIEEEEFDEALETLERAYERFIIRGKVYFMLSSSILSAQLNVRMSDVVKKLGETL